MPCSRCCSPADVIAASNGAAQLVIVELFRVVRTAQPAALPPVRAALALCFEREPRATAYVGALQRLAIADRGGAVEAAEVATAAIQSGSLQCGALQVWLQTTVNTNVIRYQTRVIAEQTVHNLHYFLKWCGKMDEISTVGLVMPHYKLLPWNAA